MKSALVFLDFQIQRLLICFLASCSAKGMRWNRQTLSEETATMQYFLRVDPSIYIITSLGLQVQGLLHNSWMSCRAKGMRWNRQTPRGSHSTVFGDTRSVTLTSHHTNIGKTLLVYQLDSTLILYL